MPTDTQARDTNAPATSITREDLLKGLQEDLSREYQAIIAYVVYSQALKGAQYMAIAKELEAHAGEELQHAITIAKQIDYLGGMPNAAALPVKLSADAEEMLRADRPCHRAWRRRAGCVEDEEVVPGGRQFIAAAGYVTCAKMRSQGTTAANRYRADRPAST